MKIAGRQHCHGGGRQRSQARRRQQDCCNDRIEIRLAQRVDTLQPVAERQQGERETETDRQCDERHRRQQATLDVLCILFEIAALVELHRVGQVGEQVEQPRQSARGDEPGQQCCTEDRAHQQDIALQVQPENERDEHEGQRGSPQCGKARAARTLAATREQRGCGLPCGDQYDECGEASRQGQCHCQRCQAVGQHDRSGDNGNLDQARGIVEQDMVRISFGHAEGDVEHGHLAGCKDVEREPARRLHCIRDPHIAVCPDHGRGEGIGESRKQHGQQQGRYGRDRPGDTEMATRCGRVSLSRGGERGVAPGACEGVADQRNIGGDREQHEPSADAFDIPGGEEDRKRGELDHDAGGDCGEIGGKAAADPAAFAHVS